MPCRSDYLAPNARETESLLVAKLLLYLGDHDLALRAASKTIYGNTQMLDEWTAKLCTVCENLSDHAKDRLMYDGRVPMARKLADWWDDHQAADYKRDVEEVDRIDSEIDTLESRLRELKKQRVGR